MVKKICEKKYEILPIYCVFFKGDNRYVIYRQDEKKMMDDCVHRIPEVAVFNNEKDARDYLKKL